MSLLAKLSCALCLLGSTMTVLHAPSVSFYFICPGIVKILNLYIILLCTHLYLFFLESIQYLQCVHCLLHQTLEIFNRHQPDVKWSAPQPTAQTETQTSTRRKQHLFSHHQQKPLLFSQPTENRASRLYTICNTLICPSAVHFFESLSCSSVPRVTIGTHYLRDVVNECSQGYSFLVKSL